MLFACEFSVQLLNGPPQICFLFLQPLSLLLRLLLARADGAAWVRAALVRDLVGRTSCPTCSFLSCWAALTCSACASVAACPYALLYIFSLPHRASPSFSSMRCFGSGFPLAPEQAAVLAQQRECHLHRHLRNLPPSLAGQFLILLLLLLPRVAQVCVCVCVCVHMHVCVLRELGVAQARAQGTSALPALLLCLVPSAFVALFFNDTRDAASRCSALSQAPL